MAGFAEKYATLLLIFLSMGSINYDVYCDLVRSCQSSLRSTSRCRAIILSIDEFKLGFVSTSEVDSLCIRNDLAWYTWYAASHS